MPFPLESIDEQVIMLQLYKTGCLRSDGRRIFMGLKRKSSALASSDHQSGCLNSVAFDEDTPRKRARFHVLPHAQQMLIDFSNPLVATTGSHQKLLPRRSRRDRSMTEETDDQWKESGNSDNWWGVDDREERRRIQNRISQRKFSKSACSGMPTALEDNQPQYCFSFDSDTLSDLLQSDVTLHSLLVNCSTQY